MDAFSKPLDIINRALQHLKLPRIASVNDFSQNAQEMGFAYDKVRQGELRRHNWRFSVRRQIVRPLDWTTMIVQPVLWNAITPYLAGQIVAYPLGNYWISNSVNTGVQPGNTAVDQYGKLVWDSYYGPLTAQAWNHQTPGQPEPTPGTIYTPTYEAGELAYGPFGNGQAALFMCIMGTNVGPMTAEGWLNTHYYTAGQIVSWPATGTFVMGPNGDTLSDSSGLGNVTYQSTSNLNIGNDPQLTQLSGGAPAWNATTAWVPSDYAYGSDNQVYLCIAPSTGNWPDGVTTAGATVTPGSDPTTDYGNAFWMPQYMYMGMWQAFAGPVQSLSIHWQQINANLVPITLAWPRGSRTWPVGTGPSSDTASSNVYRLPANWLRRAAENPKDGLYPYLGGPTFINQKDWVFEGDWMISQLCGPVMFRFSADVQDVTEFDSMFCEAFSLLLAIEVGAQCGSDQVPEAEKLYKTLIDAARTVDAIEQGTTTEPDDLLITVRM